MQYMVSAAIFAGMGSLALCLFASVYDWVHSRWLVRPATPVEMERRFRTMFSVMSEASRLSLIDYYMRKHGCGREQAMLIAVEDRQRGADSC